MNALDYIQPLVLCEITYACDCEQSQDRELSEFECATISPQPWPFVGIRGAQISKNRVQVHLLALAHCGDHVVQQHIPIAVLSKVADLIGEEGACPPSLQGEWSPRVVQELNADIQQYKTHLTQAYSHFTRKLKSAESNHRFKDKLIAMDYRDVCADGLMQLGESLDSLGAAALNSMHQPGSMTAAEFSQAVQQGTYDQHLGHPALLLRMSQATQRERNSHQP